MAANSEDDDEMKKSLSETLSSHQAGNRTDKADIVFIDGVRDIIGDFNDNAQSAELVLN